MQCPPLLDSCMENSTPEALCRLSISSEGFLRTQTCVSVGQGDWPALSTALMIKMKNSLNAHTPKKDKTRPRER